MLKLFYIPIFTIALVSCHNSDASNIQQTTTQEIITKYDSSDFYFKLSNAAISLTHQKVNYDPEYVSIPYPNGDVAPDKGVCADLIIRAYRKLGIDLQKEVHEDMLAHFDKYPAQYGLRKTDTNIDHRRVPNLMTFFKRKGQSLTISDKPKDYKYGDIVCWDLGKQSHIGIVIQEFSENKTPLIVHNIGGGQVIADALFDYPIIGHYRYK